MSAVTAIPCFRLLLRRMITALLYSLSRSAGPTVLRRSERRAAADLRMA